MLFLTLEFRNPVLRFEPCGSELKVQRTHSELYRMLDAQTRAKLKMKRLMRMREEVCFVPLNYLIVEDLRQGKRKWIVESDGGFFW